MLHLTYFLMWSLNLLSVISFSSALPFNLCISFVNRLIPPVLFFSATVVKFSAAGKALLSHPQIHPAVPSLQCDYSLPPDLKTAFVCFTARSHITFLSNFLSVFFFSFFSSILVSFQVFPTHCISELCTTVDDILRNILVSAYSYSF